MPAAALFDIPTVYLMTGFSSAVAAAMLLWLRDDHSDPGRAMTTFAAAVLALGTGFVAFALRDTIPGNLGPPIGDGAYGVAVLLLWLGCAQMFGRPVRARAAWTAGAALALYLVGMSQLDAPNAQHSLMRIALGSGFCICFIALAARETNRTPWRRSLRSVRLLRALLFGFLVVIAIRMLLFLSSGIPLLSDGTAAPGMSRLLFALIFGAFPFAVTVSVLSIANAQLSARLRAQAETDDLTGLVSRRSLYDSAQRMLAKGGGEAHCIALLMIDLDDFKAINDRHGHSRGDRVLCHVADVLRASLRPDSLIARYGGDEFCAIVPVQSEVAAFVVAERLRATMQDSPCPSDAGAIGVTLSIGVTVHRSGANLRQLVEEADQRAYSAKSQGRNRVVVRDPPLPASEQRPYPAKRSPAQQESPTTRPTGSCSHQASR